VLNFDDFGTALLVPLGPDYPPYRGVYNGFQFGSTSAFDRIDVIRLPFADRVAHSPNSSVLNNDTGSAVITAEGGGLFSFGSVWVTSFNPAYNFGLREIKGFRGGYEVASVTVDLNGEWQRVVGGFSDIDRLELQLGDFFLFDDLALNEPAPAVPEPSTLLLLGSAVLGLTSLRRRRAKR
jgi:hypothetical protein